MTACPPQISRIDLYPIKSLDRVTVNAADCLSSGALQGDRQYALFDRAGRFVNGKHESRIHAIRTQFDLASHSVSFAAPDRESSEVFDLERDRPAIQEWLGDYFGYAVEVRQNLERGFPDDTNSPGPTIVSTATLEAIASWYPELDVSDVRQRFRANIEISSVPAFWEDRLFATADRTVPFQIGDIQFFGVNPCQRCVVPTRHPVTGEAYPQFQKTFVQKRKETLPDWSERARFNHFYRLAVNTRVPETEAGKFVRVGDRLTIA